MLLVYTNGNDSELLSDYLPVYFNVALSLLDRGSLPETDQVKSQKPETKIASGITGRLKAALGLQVSRRQGYPGAGLNFEK